MQILFAFLLTPAFTPRFPAPDSVPCATYVVTLPPTVFTATPFTAPAAPAPLALPAERRAPSSRRPPAGRPPSA
ncbi:DUF6328 family protein [Streptomyces europaeiscabiei]|uniref:DUF6328 family protein n=1 Tax=Streptomyces europaeiscabiei TaxID=146819 RepID=UPI002E26DBA6|nr:DUF6328 family protein [Streptomyces europaeiscabiei]